MNRVLVSGLVTAPLLLTNIVNGQRDAKPNVLIIQTDEHNFRTLGCYRKILSERERHPWGKGVEVETPNIDYLADNGVLCNRFYASTPLSSPCRSSFVTGLYPQQTGVVTNDIPMDGKVVTFAEDMRRAGYKTGYIGKWHLDGTPRPGWAPERKFGFEDNRYMMNRGHFKRMVEKDGKFEITYEGKNLTPENFATDFWASKAIDFIRANRNDRFCCMLSIPDPHGPNTVRAPYDTLYKHFKFNKPETAGKDRNGLPQWSYGNDRMENMSVYFGMVKCIDDNIGLILEELRKQKLLENTIIVFTSDHGDMCGEHGMTNKSYPLEASAKVPFIMYYPTKIKSGMVVEEAMSVVDFAPTILGMTGTKTQTNHAGRDVSQILVAGKAPKKWNDVIFMRGGSSKDGRITPEKLAHSKSSWVSAVTSRYKLTYSEVPGDLPWLTDLKEDPDELVNLYCDPKCREIVRRLSKDILVYGEKNTDPRVFSDKVRGEIQAVVKK